MYKSFYDSPLGKIILTSDGINITELCFLSSRFKDRTIVNSKDINDNLEIIIKAKNWLDRYFRGENPSPKEIKIKLVGTDFEKCVWKEISKVKYGETITYGELAKIVAKRLKKEKMSAQAVGHSVGINPICIIVPCHRIMGANGNLTGYGEGIGKKIALLKLEGAYKENFYIPKKGNAL